MPVPYADFNDPQTLNQYSYVRNMPTLKIDPDGHCEGDECQKIQVQVEVVQQPTISTATAGKTDMAIAGGNLTYTFTRDNKPLSDTMVHEDVKNSVTVNGETVNSTTKTSDYQTDKAGQIGDGSAIEFDVPHPPGTKGNKASDLLTQNVVKKDTNQTLTFNAPDGTTCNVTETRTLTNANANGKASSRYTLKPTSPATQTARPAKAPKKPAKQPAKTKKSNGS